jgi:hypothetical protein
VSEDGKGFAAAFPVFQQLTHPKEIRAMLLQEKSPHLVSIHKLLPENIASLLPEGNSNFRNVFLDATFAGTMWKTRFRLLAELAEYTTVIFFWRLEKGYN